MKGFYIFEEEFSKGVVECLEIGYIDHIFTHQIDSGTLSEEVKMHALVSKGTKTKCSPDDTYDFEVGALISLMKMCGVDKVVRACNEAFPKETYNTYITKYERELHELKKDFDKVKDLKDFYKKNYEDIKEHYGKLGDRNKYLIDDINKKLEYIKEKDEEIKSLEASICAKNILNGKLLKDYNTAQNAYEVMVEKSADLMDEVKKLEEENKELKKNVDDLFEDNKYWKSEGGRQCFEKHRLEEQVEKLQHEYNLCLNSENALKYTVDSLNKSVAKLNKAIEGYKNDLYKVAKHSKELEEENEKLKLDCEKLQHGYIDNETIFCGGRQNGKQHTFLVELFNKIDQKKVDAAYKEAYNTTLPVWQKEVLNQMYGVYKESKEKPELPRTLDINGTVYRKSIQIKDFGEQINKLTVDSLIEEGRAFTRKRVDEWLYKIPTKREKMWERILKSHKENDVIIEVKKEDINTFWHELEERIPEITWCCGAKIFESKLTRDSVQNNAKKTNAIYFRVRTNNWLSYASDPCTYEGYEHISYLPPMRWDLFKKGRLAVKVNYDNYKEFYEACEKELGKRPVTAVFTEDFTVSICKKDGLFEIFTVEDQKETGRKIVDWEDVR